MIPDKILNYCLQNLEGTVLVKSWGEKGIFYNPDHVLKRGVSPVWASVNTFSAASGDFAKAAAIFLSLLPTKPHKPE